LGIPILEMKTTATTTIISNGAAAAVANSGANAAGEVVAYFPISWLGMTTKTVQITI
jgi:hypothetical protein